MKKLVSVFSLVLVAALLAMSLTACSGKKYSSMEDYVNSEEVQSQLSSALADAESQGMKMEIKGEGNKFIYAYTFAEGVETEGMADALKEGISAQASTFETIATTLKGVVSGDNPVVVVQYLASDGTEIYSQEFSAK